jgi:ABC-type Fe3+/spermidine/putrescine transport system ATPase subunit
MLTVTGMPGLVARQTATLFIRPNDVTIVGNGEDGNILTGVVKQATYLGNCVDYRVLVQDKLVMRVESNTRTRYAPGDPVRLHLPTDRCHIISEE